MGLWECWQHLFQDRKLRVTFQSPNQSPTQSPAQSFTSSNVALHIAIVSRENSGRDKFWLWRSEDSVTPKNSGKEGSSRKLTTTSCEHEFDSLKDRFSLRYVLGEGSYAKVYLAEPKSGTGCRAVKTIRLDQAPSYAAVHNEIDLHGMMRHSNIVSLYEVTADEPTCAHLIMELCIGGDLFDFLSETPFGQVDEAESQFLMKSALNALLYMHEKQVVHRDVKLENFVFKHANVSILNNELKLTDFGVARTFTPKVMMTTACGTSTYQAPEVIQSEYYGPKCDIWSLGVMMYIILAGAPPFDGESDADVRENVLKQPMKFDQSWEGISSKAKEMVMHMCQRDPEERPSAQQLLQHSFPSGV